MKSFESKKRTLSTISEAVNTPVNPTLPEITKKQTDIRGFGLCKRPKIEKDKNSLPESILCDQTLSEQKPEVGPAIKKLQNSPSRIPPVAKSTRKKGFKPKLNKLKSAEILKKNLAMRGYLT